MPKKLVLRGYIQCVIATCRTQGKVKPLGEASTCMDRVSQPSQPVSGVYNSSCICGFTLTCTYIYYIYKYLLFEIDIGGAG